MLFYLYRGRILGGLGLVLAVVALLVLSCGKESERPPDAWVLVDLSGSTRDARIQYSAAFRLLAINQSQLKGGRIQMLPVAGDPAGESSIRPLDVGVETDNPSTANIQRRLNVLKASQEFDDLLVNPPPHVPGSALLEALWYVADKARPGDQINVFSDALQASKLLTLYKSDISGPAQIDQLLNQVDEAGYIPELQGVRVAFVLPGITGTIKSITSKPEVKAFWQAWALRVHALLEY